MLKNQAVLEVKKDERVYQLVVDAQSPLGELYDVICQMKGYVLQRMVDEQKASEQPKQEEPKAE